MNQTNYIIETKLKIKLNNYRFNYISAIALRAYHYNLPPEERKI